MTERLTPEEIDRLRKRPTVEFNGQLLTFVTTRELTVLLQEHCERQRLRNLQPNDVTDAQWREIFGSEWVMRTPAAKRLIAAAVRVVVGGDT